MAFTLSLRRSALLHRGSPALLLEEGSRTYGEVNERVSRLAGALQAQGVAPGDRVGALALNGPRYLEFFYAVAWAGGVFVPINTRLTDAEVSHWLNDSGLTTLFVDRHFLSRLEAIRVSAPALQTVVFMDGGPAPAGCLSYDVLVESHPGVEDAGRRGQDLAGIFYTGGTTGRSKGVMISHANLEANLANGVAEGVVSQRQTVLHTAPMFHMADFGLSTTATALGCAHAFLESFSPEGFQQAAHRHSVNAAILVPTMLGMLLNHPAFDPDLLRSFQCLLYGASPMPAPVLRALMAALPDCRLVQGYGQTEASPGISRLSAEDHRRAAERPDLLSSAGRAMLTVDVRVLGPDGTALPTGEVGEICVRGPNVMLGYWNLPEQTAQALRGGWLHTGDGGRMDEDGYIFIVDRLKDMIVTGGENVFCAEVESVVHAHPAVAECAVIGIPDDRWGEAVHAVVRLRPGALCSEADLLAHCRSNLGTYKRPRSISFTDAPLPLSGAGKILKTELRRPFWEGRDRGVN